MMGAAMLKRHRFVRSSGGGRNVYAGESGAALVCNNSLIGIILKVNICEYCSWMFILNVITIPLSGTLTLVNVQESYYKVKTKNL